MYTSINDIAQLVRQVDNIQFSGSVENDRIYACIDGIKSSDEDDSSVIEISIEDNIIYVDGRGGYKHSYSTPDVRDLIYHLENL